MEEKRQHEKRYILFTIIFKRTWDESQTFAALLLRWIIYRIWFYSESVSLNVLIPKSDWHLTSPYNYTLNQTLRSWEWGKWSLIKVMKSGKWSAPRKALNWWTNSPHKYHCKCVEISIENMHADPMMWRV